MASLRSGGRSLPLLVMAAAGAAAVTLLYQLQKKRKKKKRRRIPPRNPTGIFETLDHLGSGDAHNFLLHESERLGTLVYRIWLPLFPDPNLYIVADPMLIRTILTDATTDKPRTFYQPINTLTCGLPSIFSSPTHNVQNPHWKAVRKGTVPAFSGTEVQRMKQVCERQVRRWMRELDESKGKDDDGQLIFDPYKEMIKLTFRVICEAALEYPGVTDLEIDEFTHNVDLAFEEFDRKQGANPLRRYLTFCLPDRQRAFRACHDMQAFGYKVLQHYYDTHPSGDDDDESPANSNTVIRLLVENPHLKTDRMKVAEIVVFLIGGHDTTGFSVAAALYQLAKHPDTFQTLRASLQNGGNGYDDYLQWVLRESQRLLPVAALGPARVTGRDYDVPRPPKHNNGEIAKDEDQPPTTMMMIPKGSLVLLPQYVTNHSRFVFDENPQAFDPQRWQDASPETVQSILTFAAGPRNCIGQALAKTEMATVLTLLVQRYHSLALVEEGRIEQAFTLSMVGMRLAFSPQQ